MSMRDMCVEAAWEASGYTIEKAKAESIFDAVLTVLSQQEHVMFDHMGKVHEVRGEPNNVFQAMLKAIR